MRTHLLIVATLALLAACQPQQPGAELRSPTTDIDYRLSETLEILVTSEAGDKIALKKNQRFREGSPDGTIVVIRPDIVKQTITGIGSSFTESPAFVLAHLDEEQRLQLMDQVFSENGANFSLTRTPIGATDFSVNGKYSYAEVSDDKELEHFSIAPDLDGFTATEYPGIKDESFDLLPMIKEALAIKSAQDDKNLRIIASAWTAPPWMKDIEDWYLPGTPENDYHGTGGDLKPQYVQTYADYIALYLDAYRAEGVNIWGLTPVNEPHGNSGQWESMHFTPKSQNEFIKNHLGPTLQARNYGDTKLLIYDQNRDGLEDWTDVIFGDPETAPFVHGAAVHWYESTNKVYEEVLDRVHEKFPAFSIIHTEGTIDDLGKDAPGGVLDPVRFKESGWFNNDDFWWNANATDWAYTATWAPNNEDHPIYTPVHRYARNIIVSLNHWMEGWVDWNIVLDRNGGPNHVGNFCGAPIMIDLESGQIYYTPIYYVLAQFSRTIRPGDKAVQADKKLEGLDDDALHASATVNNDGLLSVQLLNTTKEPIRYSLQIGSQNAPMDIPANSLQTVRVQL
jgi:glucosylceramidase